MPKPYPLHREIVADIQAVLWDVDPYVWRKHPAGARRTLWRMRARAMSISR